MTDLSSDLHGPQAEQPRRSRVLLARPYEVSMQGRRLGGFEDLRDAIAAARIIKREHPLTFVIVTDVATGQVVIEVEL